MPNLDRPLNLRSAIITFASFVMLAGAAFGQTEPGEHAPDDAVKKPKAAQPVDQQFQDLLDRAISVTSKRYLVANAHSPWQIFHYILAMRQESVLRLGDQKVNAIEWLSTTEPQFDKQPWLLLTPHGAKFHPTRKSFLRGPSVTVSALLSHSICPWTIHFMSRVRS